MIKMKKSEKSFCRFLFFCWLTIDFVLVDIGIVLANTVLSEKTHDNSDLLVIFLTFISLAFASLFTGIFFLRKSKRDELNERCKQLSNLSNYLKKPFKYERQLNESH